MAVVRQASFAFKEALKRRDNDSTRLKRKPADHADQHPLGDDWMIYWIKVLQRSERRNENPEAKIRPNKESYYSPQLAFLQLAFASLIFGGLKL